MFRVGCPGRPPPRQPQHRARRQLHRLRGGTRHGRHRVPRRHRGHRALRGPEPVSVNVFGYENAAVYPLRLTELRDRPHVNLLLLTDGEKRHYVLINNLSRLVTPRSGHAHASFPGVYCLHVFCRADLLADHTPHCKPHGPQRVKMPSGDDTTLFFKHKDRQLRAPFVIYADFECYTEKLATCIPNTASFTHRYQQHTPSGYCFHVVSDLPGYTSTPMVYRGPDVVDHFLESLRHEHRLINAAIDCPVPMMMTPADIEDFAAAVTCHICGKDGTRMVRDHDHLTGTYRGAAHNKCKLRLHFKGKKAKGGSSVEVPVVIHNLRGYDAHLIAPALGRHPGRINVIANNMTKYVSFSLGRLRFIDSLQFMSASLEKLVANLPSDGFVNLEAHTDHTELLKRKGVFPYDHFDGPARLEETQLPPKSAFYSRLIETDISDADYAHAHEVWTTFGMTVFAEYRDLYLLTDVLLLADVFEQFRSTCMEHYDLDPAHYYTAPGLSWDAMLKMTEVELELLTDIDMHLFVESGIRGGVSMISHKYSRANNPYTPDYDSNRPTTHITYLDANNVYGCAMSMPLPISDFRWLSREEIDVLDISALPADSKTGYILEVDLEYPRHLHDLHSDYPLAPERLHVMEEMLSPYSRHLHDQLDIGRSTSKLVPNLQQKTGYVIHHRNLQQCVDLGMKLTALHRVLAFSQSAWLEPYIRFNTEQRKRAANPFEKDFFKLMNNAIFGKTMENLRKRTDIKLVSDEKAIRKYCARPQLHAFRQFESVAAIHLLNTVLTLDRPLYAGFAILELSKLVMYGFHYGYIKATYGERARLLFTDTDSLCYEIATADIYADMLADAGQFDTSDYPTDYPNFSLANKKVLGKFKDETAGRPILEFVGLRAKMYSILLADSEKKTAKGVARYVRDRDLKHDLYRACLLGERRVAHSMNAIRPADDHRLFSVTLRKTTLSPYDDKRFVLDDMVSTRAHGHFRNTSE